MRHRVTGRRLGRDSEHRLAMRRNLVSSLFEHERVSTTLEKAKEIQSFAEKLITLSKKGNLAARRRAIALLGDRDIIDYEDGRPVKKGTVVGKLFSEIGPRYLERTGGYTRIIRLAMRRLGDNGQVVLLQLVSAGETPGKSRGSSKKRPSWQMEEPVKSKSKSKVKEATAEEQEEETAVAVEEPVEEVEKKEETSSDETASEEEGSEGKE